MMKGGQAACFSRKSRTGFDLGLLKSLRAGSLERAYWSVFRGARQTHEEPPRRLWWSTDLERPERAGNGRGHRLNRRVGARAGQASNASTRLQDLTEGFSEIWPKLFLD